MVAMLKDLNTYNNLFILRLKRYIINHLSRISFPSIKLTPFKQLSDLFSLSQKTNTRIIQLSGTQLSDLFENKNTYYFLKF